MIHVAKPHVGKREKELVMEVLDSGILAQGPKVKFLEESFAKVCNTKHAIAVNSGTAALHASLYAAGIKPGDEVITVPFTFVATANPVIMQGAKLVFADIDEKTFNIDAKEVEKIITDKTRAIIAVDLYGQIFDKEIRELAKKHDLKLIEDACQSIGATLDGKKAGSVGDLGCFSLYATKNIMSGEGGIITTDNDDHAELCRRFRHHGQSEQTRYEYHDLGYNYRMTDLHAALAIAQLERLDKFTETRIRNAKLYDGGLNVKGIITPYVVPGSKHVYHQYTIRLDNFKLTRDELLAKLKDNNVGAAVFYPKPLHLHPHFARLGYKPGDFPVSEKLAKEVMSLPVHPGVTEDDVKKIIQVIKNA